MTTNNTWQPISTVPEAKAVDIWVKAKNQPYYGRRAVHVVIIRDNTHGTDLYFGERVPDANYGEYASHWRDLPSPPID